MLKLIEAQKRGVSCVLMIDDLNNWANKSLGQEFIASGGLFYSLNPVRRIWNIITKEFFRRHHEKITVIDDTSIIGSSNIADEYGAIKYGSFDFYDLNMFTKNVGLEQSRKFFSQIADFYGLKLHQTLTNEEILQKYKEKYRDSDFSNLNNEIKIIRTHPTLTEDEIQNYIINMINKAKKEVVIIQPYYYPIKKIEKCIGDALDRGVRVELITSAKRDQPAYAPLKNFLMTKKLIEKGLEVYEMHDKYLHMKAYFADDSVFTLGSFNNDRWSWKINNEANIYVENSFEAYKFRKIIIEDVKSKCKLLNLNENIGWIRWARIQWWEFFLYCSEWVMNQKKYDKLRKKYQLLKEEKQRRRLSDIYVNPSMHSYFDFDYNFCFE